MVNPNWNILSNTPDAGNSFLTAFEAGRERKEREQQRNALSQYAVNPDDETNFTNLATHLPQVAIQERGRRAEQQRRAAQAEKQQKAEARQNMTQLADLLDNATDEQSYMAGLQAAQQLGMDVSSAPQTYDAGWVNQQRLITSVFLDKEDKLPGIAQELQAAGFEPGTPEFQKAMVGVINNKYASDYIDANGNTRRRSALNVGGQAAPPDQAVSALRNNPALAGQFDEKYGKGAAQQILEGGQPQSATGSF